MEKNEAQNRISVLRDLLAEYNRRYYVENDPLVSDFEFDALMRELEDLEKQYPEFDSPDSPTHRVGSDLEDNGKVRQGFVQRPHRYPMLSLGNTYSIAEIEDFTARADRTLGGEKFTYSCELKFDGTAICLTYRDGMLVQALTRGDGVKGDDVTRNARMISNLPTRLKGDFPPEFEIRGEVLMPYEAFDKLNRERAEQEEEPFANPRNAASGSLKLADPEEVRLRGLWCTLYHIPAESLDMFSSHSEALDAAASWGLPISEDRRICHNISEIKAYIDHWEVQRKFLPYATDGIVIKINEFSSQRSLGYTAKSPRWAVAFKFKAEQACTPVLSIDYQVGRTGAVTPVANLAPVQLSGTVVKRATLNNAGLMKEMDIRIGDWVYVEKGGEIIPKITGVELEKRPVDSTEPQFPGTCPVCGTPLVKSGDEAKWFCPNSDGCPPQIKGRMLHFISRKAMDILAGEMTVEQFYDSGIARKPSELYHISRYSLMGLEGWQDRSVTNFLQSLENSKKVPFERVLFALGIRYVGESTAKSLARHFKNIDALIAAGKEELLAVNDVGEVIAGSIYEFMRNEDHLKEIASLRASGLQFSRTEDGKTESEALKGLSIVISGNFSVSRDAIKELILANGGKNVSSVSSRTSFLLAGSKAGPEKLKKCEQLGIKVIGEEEFRAMLPQESKNMETIEELTLF